MTDYPTRTAQLEKLSTDDLKLARDGAIMNRAHSIGNDWRYARAMLNIARRINSIIRARENAASELYQGA
jgi:hypothetical protein